MRRRVSPTKLKFRDLCHLFSFFHCSCENISELHCRFTFCRDNPHLQCQVENWKCKCPSCEAAIATEPDSCSRTKYDLNVAKSHTSFTRAEKNCSPTLFPPPNPSLKGKKKLTGRKESRASKIILRLCTCIQSTSN